MDDGRVTTALLQRHVDGYQPYTPEDLENLGKVGIGEVIKCTFKRSRNPGHHRKAFALLNEMFVQQDKFQDREQFRKWVKIQAGEYTEVFGDSGFFELKSWSFDEMPQEEFEKTYQKIIDVAFEKMGQEWALHYS